MVYFIWINNVMRKNRITLLIFMIKQQFRLIYTISKSLSDVELIQLRKLQKYFPYLENDLKLMLREVLTLVLLSMISQNFSTKNYFSCI